MREIFLYFQASDKYLNRHTVREEYDGTFTSVLGLDITSLEKYHFINGRVTLKCTSSMLSVYWQSHQVRFSINYKLFQDKDEKHMN